MKSTITKTLLAGAMGLAGLSANAQAPYLVKDINPGAATGLNDITSNLTAVGGKCFFHGNDGVHGVEPWVSNGSAGGTIMLKDIASKTTTPGFGNSIIDNYFPIGSAGGNAFFQAYDSTGMCLWKSDGTTAGTVKLKVISQEYSDVWREFTEVNGKLFFRAKTAAAGTELWVSDGTEAGTHMVKDIKPGTASTYPSSFLSANGTLFFIADDGTNGNELWKSDGTEAGTVMLEITPGSGGGSIGGMVSIGGKVYFAGGDQNTTGQELWVSDGTQAGTKLVKEINPGLYGSIPCNFAKVSDTQFFFFAKDALADNTIALWKSDGTTAGTEKIILFQDMLGSSNGLFYDQHVIGMGGSIYMPIMNGIWKSDGTAAGSVLVKNVAVDKGFANFAAFTELNGKLYFTAKDGNNTTLWQTDGTDAGTTPVTFTAPNVPSSVVGNLVNANGRLFFTATDATNGKEVWALNINGPSAIAEKVSSAIQSVYPNPSANGIFNITLAATANGTIKVSNLLGEEVYNEKITANSLQTLNLSHLSDGMYLLQVINGKEISTQKITIQK